MGYISEPKGVDFTVTHKHLSTKEADEISAFIEQYKAEKSKSPVKLEVTTNADELAFLAELLKRVGVSWKLVES